MRKLLIIEDVAVYAELLCAMLKMRNWEPSVAPTMAAAFALLAANKFDATILDLRLPDSDTMTSLDHIPALKAAGAGRLVIITGADVQPDLQLMAKLSGADGILSKNELRADGSLSAALRW